MVVEEDKERPVDEPGSLLQSLQGGSEHTVVNELLETVEVVESGVPVLHKDLRRQLAPHTVQVVGVGGLDENTVEIQVLASTKVVTTLVLNLKQ